MSSNQKPTRPETALVLGGSSEIGLATVRHLAGSGLRRVVLAARNAERLEVELQASPLALDEVIVMAWDAREIESHDFLLDRATQRLGRLDLVLCAVGSLGHGAGIDASPEAATALFEANFSGPASALLAAAHHLKRQGSGTIVALSSVAGLRARRSNFLYGSAKAGFDTFVAGLGDALVGTDVRVITVRPGFVRTRMTDGLEPAPFASDAEDVAIAIAEALDRPGDRIVYVPKVLGPLFAGLRAAPRPIWRRIAGDR
ncbi:MAG: SDR family NAD(P)-dependent oxidoreductase [Ilumatobacteraceae bacterium]